MVRTLALLRTGTHGYYTYALYKYRLNVSRLPMSEWRLARLAERHIWREYGYYRQIALQNRQPLTYWTYDNGRRVRKIIRRNMSAREFFYTVYNNLPFV